MISFSELHKKCMSQPDIANEIKDSCWNRAVSFVKSGNYTPKEMNYPNLVSMFRRFGGSTDSNDYE